jgi:glucose/arabinose dehydrogenase
MTRSKLVSSASRAALLRSLSALGLCAASACASSAPPVAGVDSAAHEATAAIEIPTAPRRALLPRRVVARGLDNPRGMQPVAEHAMLVSEAGTGVPDAPSGRLTRLEDLNADGDYLDDGERRVLLDKQPSRNLLDIVRRDEVFGMAGMDAGDGHVLVALAFFGGPSTLFQVDGDVVTQWGSTHANVNDVAFDPSTRQWYGVASTSDEVVRLVPGGGAERVLKIPPLASGQDPVPAYLRYDPVTRALLVTLFSGSPEGEEGGRGVELVPRAGDIIAVEPSTKRSRPVVAGLSVPTDLEVAPDGTIYVLEFCDAFLDPIVARADMAKGPSHGGFRRFSGRLLRIDRKASEVSVIAEGLDAPTNLVLVGDALYVAEGMGTPGRQIPGPNGPVPLEGMIERIDLPAAP